MLRFVLSSPPVKGMIGRKQVPVLEEPFDITMFLQWPENAKKKRIPRLRKKSLSALEHNSRWFDKYTGFVGYLSLSEHENEKGAIENWGTDDFPDELVEEILSRLPVKSLIRFSCVCKSWNHLIYGERFVSLHMNNYKTSHLFVAPCNYYCSNGLGSFPFAGAGVYCDNDYVASSPKLVELGRPLFAGSCNGVLCLRGYCADDILLWNPATKNRKIIPKSNIPRKMDKFVYSTIGFGFDPKTNDYKVLQMVYDKLGPKPRVTQLELYSLRKNSWRKVDSHGFLFRPNPFCYDLVCNLPFTGYRVTCNLVISTTSIQPIKWEIFMFDMSTEMFDTISIPDTIFIPSSIEDKPSGNNNFITLFHFKESLALGLSRTGFGRQDFFDIWVLNDFYCRESRSWSNLFSVEHGISPLMPRIIGSWENHIIFQNIVSYNLGAFDLSNPEFTASVLWLGCRVTTAIYRESLVQLGKINEIKRQQCKRSRKQGKRQCKRSRKKGKRSLM